LKDNSFMEYADQGRFPFVMNWGQVAFCYEARQETKQANRKHIEAGGTHRCMRAVS